MRLVDDPARSAPASRMLSDGRMSAPRVGAAMVAVRVPSGGLDRPAWTLASLVRSWPGWSGMGILLPLASRLMLPPVPSGATG